MSDGKTPNEASTPDALSGALGAILSNPDMLGMISSIAKELKSNSEAEPPKQEIVPPAAETDVGAIIGKLAPLLASSSTGSSKKEDDRACLLRALKPYLSEGRSEAIEYIIKFSVLAKALKNLT